MHETYPRSSTVRPWAPIRRAPLLSLLCGGLLLAGVSAAAEWPQFRGPARDGRSQETGLLTEWPDAGPETLWEVAVGGGYSGIAVAGGRVFTLSAEQAGEELIAWDAKTGRELWRYATDRNRPDGEGGGPRSTPTVVGDTVYAISAFGKLHAVDAAEGAARWSVDLVRDLNGVVPDWGYASSPLVLGDTLYVETGGGKGNGVTALDRHSGTVLWRGGDDVSAYSSPQVVEFGGVPQLISFGGGAITSLDPSTGDTLWKLSWQTRYGVNVAMPLLVSPELLLVSSGYNVGGMMIQGRVEDGVLSISQAWRTQRLRTTYASVVAHDGAVFGFDSYFLRCLDAESGKELWNVRRTAGSILYADGHLLVVDGGGQLFLAEASRKGWVQKGKAKILRGRTWNAPALADGVLYARSLNALVALRVGAVSPAP